MSSAGFTLIERRAVTSLSMLYAFRMLGLFMVLPILALYTEKMPGGGPLMIGLALGVYGFTQAILQIPFGLLSDKVGRKPMIYIGLSIFALGGVVAATADSIYGIIFGRLLQGGGAIASTLMALLSDLTQEQNRTKAMASIGVSVGISFSIAVVLGPLIDSNFGLSAIFWMTSALAVIGMGVCYFYIPSPVESTYKCRESTTAPQLIKQALYDTQLLRLNFGIFSLHFCLMACFVVFPLVISEGVSLPGSEHWKIYLPILVLSFIAMLPFIIIAEKKRQVKKVFVGAILLIATSLGLLFLSGQNSQIVLLGLFVFFMAFNLLEATLPSLVSKLSFAGGKGTAMGLYSTSQFIGAFAGGVSGGFIAQYYGIDAVFMFCMCFLLLWAVVAFSMDSPRYLNNVILSLSETGAEAELEQQLLGLEGVEEAVVIGEQKKAYLKVDQVALDRSSLKQFEASV